MKLIYKQNWGKELQVIVLKQKVLATWKPKLKKGYE